MGVLRSSGRGREAMKGCSGSGGKELHAGGQGWAWLKEEHTRSFSFLLRLCPFRTAIHPPPRLIPLPQARFGTKFFERGAPSPLPGPRPGRGTAPYGRTRW